MDDSAPQAEPPGGPGDWPAWLRRLPLAAAPLAAAAAAAAALIWRRRRNGKAEADDVAAPPPTPEACEAAEPGRGRAAQAPWEIPHRGWKDILWRTYHASGRNRLGFMAGGVTFYLLLAIFPAIAAFASICGLFLDLGAVARLLDQLSAVLPPQALDLIGGQLVRLSTQRHEALSVAFVFSALASAWSANAGLKAMFEALNAAYGETERRPYLHRTLISYLGTLAAVTVLALVTLTALAAPAALSLLGLSSLAGVLAPARWVLVYLIAAGGLVVVYRRGPSRTRAKLRWVVVGAGVAALAWMLGSMGFSAYLNTFTRLGATYGSLGAVIGFMLWVWFSVVTALNGACLNAEIEHQTAHDTTVGPDRPMGERGAAMADRLGAAFTVSPREARHIVRDFLIRQVGHVRRWWTGLWRR